MKQSISSVTAFLLVVGLTGCSSRPWETPPTIQRLMHWNDPIAAWVGDTPIYRSQVRDYYLALPKNFKDQFREQKKIDRLLDMTITSYLWRKAALERGALQSADFKARLQIAQNEASQKWIEQDNGDKTFSPTEAEIQEYVHTHPQYFPKRHSVVYRVERYSRAPASDSSKGKRRAKNGSDAHALIKKSEESGYYFVGVANHTPMDILESLPVGKPSALIPCDKDLCRYTKKQDVIDPLTDFSAAVDMISRQKTALWIQSYCNSLGAVVTKKEILDDVFDH